MTYKEWAAKNKNNGAITCDEAYKAGAASRDAEVKNWSACEAAANIPSVLEYVNQLEQERDQLREQVKMLQSVIKAVEVDSEEVLDFDECTAMLVPMDTYHGLIEALAATELK